MISYREVDHKISKMLASHAQCDFTEWLTLVEVWIPLPFHTVSSTAISSRELTRFRRNVIMPQFQKYCHEISSGPCPSEETLDPIVAKLDNIIGTARCEAWLFGELGGRVVERIRERHLSNLVSKLGLDPAAPAADSLLDTNQGWLEWFKRKSERYPALQRIVALINICQ
ncbi:hypothetical protein GQ42DRAFT_161722 [Ramicandelaber brevisporus]|nr:hypothetical protein GQ42DRAFT_161722 [Ramicandelaber brevisporus]